MKTINRRNFMALGAVWAGLVAAASKPATDRILHGEVKLKPGGLDISPITHTPRTAIPSSCWQCVTRCAILGYLEKGRLVKIEGNPAMFSTRGKLCSRGQAGINQLYNPDRLLYPLKRMGKRGEGKWKRISWAEALDLLIDGGEIAGRTVKGLKALREAGTPEKFLFHYGRMVGTDWIIIVKYFLSAFGTATIGDHTSICNAGEDVANWLTRSNRRNWDFGSAKIILNFGSNLLEAHTNHVPMALRCAEALARGAKMITFDVRLSNTAARSFQWVPVKPATDLAVILAMCQVLLATGHYDSAFIENHTNVTVPELQQHLADYTPEWAEPISGVPAQQIRDIAIEYATTRPGICISFRGAFMHYNGVQTERAIWMLEAIAGNSNALSGTGGVGAAWKYPFPPPQRETKALDLLQGEKGAYAFPIANVSHQILTMIDKGPERPDIYMVYCHNPVYSNGNCLENARIFKDESKIPFLAAVDVTLSETSELADLVLPDTTYLERWACDGKTSPEMYPEYYIRQPVHPPLGEARNFCDVVCELARRLGLDLGFQSAQEFVKGACENTPVVKAAGGFAYMKEHGVWTDKSAIPQYPPEQRLVIKSEDLAAKGFPAIPAWMPVPEHQHLSGNQLILTTFKVNVQTHSRTQNCKWLTEIYHKNPAWINPAAATPRGIKTNDPIRVKSTVGEIITRAFVTEAVHPAVIAISNHMGHWAHGRYASGRESYQHVCEPDCTDKWWKDKGQHPNLIIPNRGDPIGGTMCWNDTVVEVEKV
jgi:thiosulfate reductase/polysulfide reductase chain A